MKKATIITLCMLSGITLFQSCSGSSESPRAVADEWCKLNLKVSTAATPDEEKNALKERDHFIAGVKERHKDDEKFIVKLEEEMLKCD